MLGNKDGTSHRIFGRSRGGFPFRRCPLTWFSKLAVELLRLVVRRAAEPKEVVVHSIATEAQKVWLGAFLYFH